MTVRAGAACDNDRDEVAALLAYSFPDINVPDLLRDRPNAQIFIVRQDKRLAAAVLWRPASVLWRGTPTAMALAGPGATDPRFRRQGLLAHHQTELLDLMRVEGCVLSGLETPVTRWHARNGWGLASAVARYRAQPHELRPTGTPHTGEIINDASIAELDGVYRADAARRFGPLARDEMAWTRRLAAGQDSLRCDRIAWREPHGRCTGYAIYRHSERPEDGLELVVDELVTTTPSAAYGLWTFLSEHNNVRQLRWDAPTDWPLPSLLAEPRSAEPQQCVDKMLRVVDIATLAFPAPTSSETDPRGLVLHVDDAQAPWNTSDWVVEQDSRDSPLRLLPAQTSDADGCRIPASSLGPLLSGYLNARAAHAAGLVLACSRKDVARLQALFAVDAAPYCPDEW